MTYPHDNRSNGYPQDPRGAAPNDRAPERDDGPLLPEGDYAVKAKKHRWGFTNGSQPHEQIGILLVITEGAHAGKTLLYYGNFHPNSAEITVKALRALGWRGEDPAKMDSIYEGAPATAVVEHDTYDGKTRAKVKWINSSDVVMKKEMDPNEVKAFGTRMRALFRQIPGSSSTVAQPPKDQRREPPREPTRDDFGAGSRDRQRDFGDGRGDPRDAPPSNDDRPPWGDRGPR